MILRKPYAFLIKNFKKIHFIMVLIMIFLSFKTNNLLTFFKEYINDGTYIEIGNLANRYINGYMYISIIIIIAISLVVYILMKQKKKPTLLYILVIGFYIALTIVFFQLHNTLVNIQFETINPQLLRIIRDIILIFSYSQYIIITFIGVRAVGFDIKKFNFGEDLEQLEIEATDDEEFELQVGVNTGILGRKIRAQKREFKYFIFENVFIISFVSIIVVVTISIFWFLNYQIYNKVYNEQEEVKTSNYVFSINNSYITSLNYKGDLIAPNDKTYVIVQVNVENISDIDCNLSLDDINLIINDKVYIPDIKRYDSFFDFGKGYRNQIIDSNNESSFIFVFEIDEKYKESKKIFRYTETLYVKSNKLKVKYKRILLEPTIIDEVITMGEANLEEKIWLGESAIKDSYLTINNLDIKDKFEYEANSCVLNECNVITRILLVDIYAINKTLLKIDANYNPSDYVISIGYNKINDLISKFGKIKYLIDDQIYYSLLINETPNDQVEDYAFFEVSNKIKDADVIELVLTIRNMEYKFVLK